MSWEDALWDFLLYFKLAKNPTILVPEFFCPDVVNNMMDHGLQPINYHVEKNLQPSSADFIKKIKQTNPDIVVIFHPVGMTNPLFKQTDKWLPLLSQETIIIEDCVHRVIDPDQINLLTKRHIVMDSLRKVSPLPGSNVYTHPSVKMSKTRSFLTWWYELEVVAWWLIFQILMNISTLINYSRWNSWWNLRAEWAMLKGYDKIGDSRLAGNGWPIFSMLARHIDFDKIRKCKIQQAQFYQKLLSKIWDQNIFFKIKIDEKDFSQLRGYPLGIEIKYADQVLQKLRKNNLLVRFELTDCIWSQKQKIVYLPLGPHLKMEQIEEIGEITAKGSLKKI